jgi:nanoRNase/pAp phosphatase (c-di-AMP/oligoRNAs hydrolase)
MKLHLSPDIKGVSKITPSCARLIYDYYGGHNTLSRFDEMVEYADKADSADLTPDEVNNPKGWILLSFIMDPRTGLGRFKDFTISNYDLMKKLALACKDMKIDDILALPDVLERIKVYNEQQELFVKMIHEHTRTEGPVIVTDLRGVETVYTGNRFTIYSLYPEQNINMWIIDGKAKQNCVISVGYSIINRTAGVDVGSLLLTYGGGGHRAVGTCQVPYTESDRVIGEILAALKE